MVNEFPEHRHKLCSGFSVFGLQYNTAGPKLRFSMILPYNMEQAVNVLLPIEAGVRSQIKYIMNTN